MYSFNGNKIITSSGGGMLMTHDEDVARQARFLSQQARDDAPHYEHATLGYNYRMSNIVAAIGLGQMQVLRERVARRRQIFTLYERELADIDGLGFMPEAGYGTSTRWLTVMSRPGPDPHLRRRTPPNLERFNIELRPIWKPMHMQPVFQGARTIGGAVARHLFENGLRLPGTGLGDEDIITVCRHIREALVRR